MFANTQMMGKDPRRPGRGGDRDRIEEPADEDVSGGLATPGARAEATGPASTIDAPGPNAMSLNFEELKAAGGSSLLGSDTSNYYHEEEVAPAFDPSSDEDGFVAADPDNGDAVF